MTPILRLRLLAAACAALPAFALAEDAPEASGVEGAAPMIHGRATPPQDIGKPPAFVTPSSGAKDCRARREDFDAHLAFKNQKMVWNALRIATVGASYRIEACKAAEKAFDRAAELSDQKGSGRAFERASARTFEAGSACRRAFDELFAKDCADAQGDGCKAAEAEKRELAYLDEQNARFSKDIAAGPGRAAKLARCKEGEPGDGGDILGPRASAGAKPPAKSKPPVVKPTLASTGPGLVVPAIIKAPLKWTPKDPAQGVERTAPPPVKTETPPPGRTGLWGSIVGFGKSVLDSIKKTGEAIQEKAKSTWHWAVGKAKAAWEWTKEKAKNVRMEAVDIGYRLTTAVVNPLRNLVGEGNIFRDALDRVRLEALKTNLKLLHESAQSGNARAEEKIKRLYKDDIEREDYQPKAEQSRIKALALRIAEDKMIWSAYMEWLGAGASRQQAVLQKIADYTAGELGTEQLTLLFKSLKPGLFGYHGYSPEVIALNTNEFGRVDEGRFRIVNTPSHETAHGYQHKIAREGKDAGFSLIASLRDQAVLMEANGSHYLRDGVGYYTQPMEQHARAVGSEVVRAVHNRADEERALAAAAQAAAASKRE